MRRLGRRLLLGAAPLLAGCSPAGLANAFTPGGYRLQADLPYGAGPRQAIDLYLPAERRPRALLAFFHGGSWRGGDRADYPFLAQPFTQSGFAVAVVGYRLHPEVVWPVFLEDGAAALAWLRREEPGLPLLAMGHSAGAFIAAALALDPHWLAAAGLPGGREALAGWIGLAGPYDFQPERPVLRAIFAAAPEGRARAAAEASALRGAPPGLLLHGVADTEVEPEQSSRLAARLAAAGAEARLTLYPGVGHIGIVAALAAPLRFLGLARAPVREDILGFAGGLAG